MTRSFKIHWPGFVSVASVMLLLVVGMLGLVPVSSAAAQEDATPVADVGVQDVAAAPTVSEITIDSYDCATGTLLFHVDVTDVPAIPEGTSGFDYPLFYSFTAHYMGGSDYVPGRFSVWSPPADQDPYSGTVDLSLTVPDRPDYRTEWR